MRSRPLFSSLVLCVLLLLCPLVIRAETSFQDVYGNSLSFQGVPERVVSLYGSFAEAWMLAGGELVGDVYEGGGPELEVVSYAHSYPLPPQRQEGRDVVLVVALAVGR